MKRLKIAREDVLNFMSVVLSVVETKVDISTYFHEVNFENEEPTEMDVYFQGVSNGFLAEIFHATTGYEIEVVGDVEVLFPCPCCGSKTLTEPSVGPGTGYDICPYCNWEDDGTTDINADTSINRGSMRDYRKKISTDTNQYYIDKWFKA